MRLASLEAVSKCSMLATLLVLLPISWEDHKDSRGQGFE